MSNDRSVTTYVCPAPGCGYTTGSAVELADHVNADHSGEYKRADWPDTEAGRATRARDRGDDEE